MNQVRRWSIRLLAIGGVTFALVTWQVGSRMVAPANRTVALPATTNVTIVSTSLKSDSGAQIATWHIPQADASATVILVHPIRANRLSMLTRAKLLHDAGYSIVLIDLQAHGESPGEHITMGHRELHDVQAAVDFARRANADHKIVVVGWSLGGAAALLASPLDIE